jgi:hypothetical protein
MYPVPEEQVNIFLKAGAIDMRSSDWQHEDYSVTEPDAEKWFKGMAHAFGF